MGVVWGWTVGCLPWGEKGGTLVGYLYSGGDGVGGGHQRLVAEGLA